VKAVCASRNTNCIQVYYGITRGASYKTMRPVTYFTQTRTSTRRSLCFSFFIHINRSGVSQLHIVSVATISRGLISCYFTTPYQLPPVQLETRYYMIMDDEAWELWINVIVAYLNPLSQHFTTVTEAVTRFLAAILSRYVSKWVMLPLYPSQQNVKSLN
jgi:hypothetical protein